MIDKRYVPDDPNLPGLRELFPPEGGAPAYVVDPVRELTNVTVDPASAEVEYVRYWPGRRCVVQWRFPAGEDDVIISAELQPEKAGKRRAVGEHHLMLEDRRLLLQAFPYDDTLPGIVRAVSPSFMQEVVAPAMGLSA